MTVTRSVNSLTAVHCFGDSNQLSQEYNTPHPEIRVPGLCGRHENCITTPHKIEAIQEAFQLLPAGET